MALPKYFLLTGISISWQLRWRRTLDLQFFMGALIVLCTFYRREKERNTPQSSAELNSANTPLTPFLCGEKNRFYKSPHEKLKIKGATPVKQNQGTNVRQQKNVFYLQSFIQIKSHKFIPKFYLCIKQNYC